MEFFFDDSFFYSRLFGVTQWVLVCTHVHGGRLQLGSILLQFLLGTWQMCQWQLFVWSFVYWYWLQVIFSIFIDGRLGMHICFSFGFLIFILLCCNFFRPMKWTFSDCSEPRCPRDCSMRGDCIDGICLCEAGFDGEGCEHELLFPFRCSAQRHGYESSTSCKRGLAAMGVLPPAGVQVLKVQFESNDKSAIGAQQVISPLWVSYECTTCNWDTCWDPERHKTK